MATTMHLRHPPLISSYVYRKKDGLEWMTNPFWPIIDLTPVSSGRPENHSRELGSLEFRQSGLKKPAAPITFTSVTIH